MKIDYSIPKYVTDTLCELETEIYNHGEIDGFDSAYYDGYSMIMDELSNWDFGLSDSYLKGIQAALNKLEKNKIASNSRLRD